MKVHRQLFAISLLLPFSLLVSSCSRDDAGPSSDPAAGAPDESVAVFQEGSGIQAAAITEAATGFDNLTNSNDPAQQGAMDAARVIFAEEIEGIDDGLGPTYNAQSCRECHQNPVIGAGSQVTEFRAGHFNGVNFIDHPGGSLINDRAIDPAVQERIAAGQEVRTFRLSLSLMGDGFVEAVDSNLLQQIASGQPAGQRGQLIQVPVLEGGGAVRAGRFGWKNQQASLLSFAADAYVNEEGITSPLIPTENTSNGVSVANFDTVPDPEDDGEDIAEFALFMRSLKAPPRDPSATSASAIRGQNLFMATLGQGGLGCAVCHVQTLTTLPAGTVINNGTYTVPAHIGDKAFHPFGDYLLHDIGTGDGIVQNGGQTTRTKVRTAPLWGMRARDRLMHDGESVSRSDAIARHGGQASGSSATFANLSTASQNDVINFLNSL